MTRNIKASEVREGMEIEWSDRGWYHRGVVAAAECNYHVGVWVQSSDGFEMSVEPDQVLTVLNEPQPAEPTAFGACVEVGGVKYVRIHPRNEWFWVAGETPHTDADVFDWSCLTNQGHVTVINPDPFSNTEARELRVWERVEDVPVLIPFRVAGFAYTYRKINGRMEKLADDGIWAVSGMVLADFADYGPFTEALDA